MENNMNYSINPNETDDATTLTHSAIGNVDTSSAADVKKKRGRKKKNAESDETDILTNQLTISIDETNSIEQPAIVTPKKRGRKPKGGKLILKPEEMTDQTKQITNIILHLKCSMNDLNERNKHLLQLVTDPMTYNPTVPPSIMTYNSNQNAVFSNFTSDNNVCDKSSNITSTVVDKESYAYNEFVDDKQSKTSICQSCNLKLESSQMNSTVDDDLDDDGDANIKDINSKLKKLKLQLYKNSNPDKKSACFWCTYEYDNQTCYIPKYELDEQIYGYGSFCRPECAVAYLMKETIDDSTKFERYHLLNKIYSKVYDYKKNIKPAPNPYFLLNKFYGNLSIQEYRKLLKTEHMMLVIEKPMTRILPELHEDNEDFIMNIYGAKSTTSNQTGFYKVKRQSEKQKGPSKSSIMKENFGIA